MRQTDLRTAYAHLGIHPGDMGPQEAQIIFNAAMNAGENGVFVEVNPDAGRATVILGTAAKNANARLYVLDKWQTKNPQELRWFDLAVMLHQLSGVIVRCEASEALVKEVINGNGIDLVLVNGEFEGLASLPLKDGAVIIKRRSSESIAAAECFIDHRPAISAWKKISRVIAPEGGQTSEPPV